MLRAGVGGMGAGLLLILLLLLLPHAALAQTPADARDTEMRRIANQLQCPVCEGTSVADSHAAIAADIRRIVTEKLIVGESEAQILQYFVDRYGVAILREPPATGFYLAVWWVPVAALAVGLGAVFLITKNRRQKTANPQSPTALPEPDPGLDMDAYRKRLREMEHRQP